MRYTDNYVITSHDVDINNHLRPSLVQRYMIETADHQMRDRKPTYYELFVDGKAFILTRISIEIYRQTEKYDEITVQTWRCPEKGATFIRCFVMVCKGEIVAKGYSVWAVVNHETGKLCKASEVDLSNYEMEEPHEMGLKDRFRLPKDLKFEKVGTKQVAYSDVDINLHMNNTYYPDMLWGLIPDIQEKEVTSVNLRYQKEAPLGGEITIYMAKLPAPVPEDSRAEETYCFYTEVEAGTNVEAMIGVRKVNRCIAAGG
ncbi:acyl-[acyl-carrier-protein] thioesterase [Emergencia sp. 1XD21-10]|uniref:acyl-[acyl-carrier-protein] thioesterase n=1 Tax=Emergencia sp. 1XD21-10 TaxID=2304569 RepID=UPI00137A2740|nr:acyl-ACP thioesterase domain-containing protein [Emergencia sp. 1XD21-10]MCI9638554.1 hypothetical protein [Emergencia sp.]NCE99725.1 hypothetical protein [Emergencia sp. 1XD21-10]